MRRSKKGGAAAGELDFMDVWYPIQVKQRDRLGRPDVDRFEAIMTRHDRTKGFLVSFDYSSDPLVEIGAFFCKSGRVIRRQGTSRREACRYTKKHQRG